MNLAVGIEKSHQHSVQIKERLILRKYKTKLEIIKLKDKEGNITTIREGILKIIGSS